MNYEKPNPEFMFVLRLSIANLYVYYYVGKYFSISIEDQSAPCSKVAIRYKTKHQVS